MTTFTPKQLRNIGEAALTGNVPPTNDTQSDAAKGSVDAVAALHAAAQAKIKAAGSLSMIYPPGFRHPSWGERRWVTL